MGQPVDRCGDLGWRDLPPHARGDAYERARACVVAALRDRRAFTVTWGGAGIDSFEVDAYAGRDGGYGYEVRWFHFDSCPSGCGSDEPVWNSILCAPLVDLRVACPAEAKKRKPDSELLAICESVTEPPGEKRKNRLELRCALGGGETRCGWDELLRRDQERRGPDREPRRDGGP